ncbi:hypothetical protein GIB67_026216 [Kingdonia uniflora]|uniref:Carboxymethylenebutenolidase homolog n=1 Tax=Kingdonia uniflora TaxID=39325 RepID=A0A7J7LA16_9MAGN|nr:hypothetical protein GIB67_026216 [Kingdonia uniflora]
MISTRDRLKQTKEKLVSPLKIYRKPNSKKNDDLEMGDPNERLTVLETTVSALTSTVGELVEQLRLTNLAKASTSVKRRGRSKKKGVMEAIGIKGKYLKSDKENDKIKSGYKSTWKHEHKGEAKGEGSSSKEFHCNHCKASGHIFDYCWKLHPELRPKEEKSKKDRYALATERKCNASRRRCSYVRRGMTCKVFFSQVKIEDGLDDEACELVNGVELILGEDTDCIRAYLFKAAKNNNGKGILLLSDVLGFEDSSTRDFAYRVACNGYNVLVPDLFRGNPWRKNRPQSEYEDWRAGHPSARVANDINTSAKWLVDEFIAAKISNKLGIIGFCYGGGRLLEILAQEDQRQYFNVGVCFYGTRMDPSLAPSVQSPILFVTGDSDPLCPVGALQDMEKSIGRGSRVVVFKDRGHGFVHRPQSSEEDADADEAFSIMRNWLHDGLLLNKI